MHIYSHVRSNSLAKQTRIRTKEMLSAGSLTVSVLTHSGGCDHGRDEPGPWSRALVPGPGPGSRALVLGPG